MNQILYSGKTNENSNKKIIITLVILLVIILVVLALIPKLAGDKILANVYIGDVAVGSMTKDEATTTLQEKINQYANRNVTLILGKKEYQVSASEMGFCTKETPTEMVDKVYDYANDEAKRKYLAKKDIEFTNAKKDGEPYYTQIDFLDYEDSFFNEEYLPLE